MDEQMLTVQDVAARLKVHPNAVRRWLNEGKLKGARFGGTKTGWRVVESDLRQFIEEAKRGSR